MDIFTPVSLPRYFAPSKPPSIQPAKDLTHRLHQVEYFLRLGRVEELKAFHTLDKVREPIAIYSTLEHFSERNNPFVIAVENCSLEKLRFLVDQLSTINIANIEAAEEMLKGILSSFKRIYPDLKQIVKSPAGEYLALYQNMAHFLYATQNYLKILR